MYIVHFCVQCWDFYLLTSIYLLNKLNHKSIVPLFSHLFGNIYHCSYHSTDLIVSNLLCTQVLAHHGPKKPSKVLTEEERKAILQADDGNDGIDQHSNGSGKLGSSWSCVLTAML